MLLVAVTDSVATGVVEGAVGPRAHEGKLALVAYDEAHELLESALWRPSMSSLARAPLGCRTLFMSGSLPPAAVGVLLRSYFWRPREGALGLAGQPVAVSRTGVTRSWVRVVVRRVDGGSGGGSGSGSGTRDQRVARLAKLALKEARAVCAQRAGGGAALVLCLTKNDARVALRSALDVARADDASNLHVVGRPYSRDTCAEARPGLLKEWRTAATAAGGGATSVLFATSAAGAGLDERRVHFACALGGCFSLSSCL